MIEGPLGGARVQQRVRPAQPAGLFPHLRDARCRWTRPAGAARLRLPQADHAGRWRRLGQPASTRRSATCRRERCSRRSAARACASASAAARPPAWASAATAPSSTSPRCSGPMPRWSAVRRRSSTPAAASARPIRSSRSTTSAPAACPMRCPSWPTAPGAARAFISSAFRCWRPACRRPRSGATNRRSATSSRWRPSAWHCCATCASASVARSTSSARSLADQTLQLAGPGRRLRGRHVDGRAVRQGAADASARAHARPRSEDRTAAAPACDLGGLDLAEVALAVLRLPAVASKSFLITIGDRTVGGLTARDQMVGPWQVPVADCAVGLLGLSRPCGRRAGNRRALAGGHHRCGGRLAHGDRRVAHQPAVGLSGGASRTSSFRPTGWPTAARRRTTPTSSLR